MLGAESMKVKDRTKTWQAMPKIAQAVRDCGDLLFQARMLAMIAHLQAKAGDFAGARLTSDLIPTIKHRDFPGPRDGFYDAIKPGVLALIAQLQMDIGDKAGASEGLRRAVAMSHAIEAPGERIVAQIAITQKLIECGDRDIARTLLDEAISFSLEQPEPLRSRSLAMLAESQVNAGDTAGATKTTSAIRDYPGLEKCRALNSLADWHKKAGDDVTSKALLREALHTMKVKAPEDAKSRMGKVSSQRSISAHRFIEFEFDIQPTLAEQLRQTNVLSLQSKLGEIQESLRMARAMTGESRRLALFERGARTRPQRRCGRGTRAGRELRDLAGTSAGDRLDCHCHPRWPCKQVTAIFGPARSEYLEVTLSDRSIGVAQRKRSARRFSSCSPRIAPRTNATTATPIIV